MSSQAAERREWAWSHAPAKGLAYGAAFYRGARANGEPGCAAHHPRGVSECYIILAMNVLGSHSAFSPRAAEPLVRRRNVTGWS